MSIRISTNHGARHVMSEKRNRSPSPENRSPSPETGACRSSCNGQTNTVTDEKFDSHDYTIIFRYKLQNSTNTNTEYTTTCVSSESARFFLMKQMNRKGIFIRQYIKFDMFHNGVTLAMTQEDAINILNVIDKQFETHRNVYTNADVGCPLFSLEAEPINVDIDGDQYPLYTVKAGETANLPSSPSASQILQAPSLPPPVPKKTNQQTNNHQPEPRARRRTEF